MTTTQRLFVVNGVVTVRLVPELAMEIGLHESLVLLQIDYLLYAKGTLMTDGNKWVKCSVRHMQSTFFPFWSVSTLGRTMAGLVESGFLRSQVVVSETQTQIDKEAEDTTLWYTYGPACATLEAAKLTSVESGPIASMKPKKEKKPGDNPTTFEVAVALAEVCVIDFEMNKGRMLKEAKSLGHTPAEIKHLFGPGSVWYTVDFRGKQGSPPSPSQVRSEWKKLSGLTAPAQSTVKVRASDGSLNI